MTCNTYLLSCGMRVIHLPLSSEVVYCGIGINAGARDEQPGEEGLAHFCEHATFKGTIRRRPSQVLNYLESVGGDLNAYTNKSDTIYHAAVPRQHVLRAVDLLVDIVFHSTYPDSELIHEREVICDEIESYNDTPNDLIYDEIDNIIFNGQPLGHNILGTSERVRSFGHDAAAAFTARNYRPEKCVFFISGNVNMAQIIRHLNQFMADYSPTLPVYEHPSATSYTQTVTAHRGETVVRHLDTHQAHVMLGAGAFSVFDERHFALFLLNNYVGGPGMNARFNLILRERKGLVYSVESTMSTWDNCGAWYTYFGCDAHDVDRCLHLLRFEMDHLMRHPLSENILHAAKRQIKGQMGVGYDNRQNLTLDTAADYLHLNKPMHLPTLFAKIDALTAEDVQRVAAEVFAPENITTLIFT